MGHPGILIPRRVTLEKAHILFSSVASLYRKKTKEIRWLVQHHMWHCPKLKET